VVHKHLDNNRGTALVWYEDGTEGALEHFALGCFEILRSAIHVRGADLRVLFLNDHDLILSVLDSLPFAWVDWLELRLAPAIVRANCIPNIHRWRSFVKLHIHCKATVWSVEAHRLSKSGAALVSINIHMQEPFDVVINCHVTLRLHVTMTFVAQLEAIILDANLDTAQVVRTFQEGTVRHTFSVNSAAEHWDTNWISKASQTSQVLAPAVQSMEDGHHRTCDVSFTLSPCLSVDLSHETIVHPLVPKVIIVSVVTKVRHAILSSAV